MKISVRSRFPILAAFLTTLLLGACSSSGAGITPTVPQIPTATPTIPPVPTAPAATATKTAAPTITPTATLPPAPTLIPYEEAIRLFDYNPLLPLDVKETAVKRQDGIAVRDISYASIITGERVSAYLVVPPGKGPFAGMVFMHWLGEPNGNREEFLDEAVALARKGVASVLINGRFPWSVGPSDLTADRAQIIGQVIDLRRALDLLLTQPGVDVQRIGYVGHDFGAMYGSILAGVDKRAKAYALMAGTPGFSDWLLKYWSPAQGEKGRSEYKQAMVALDPISYVSHAAPAALFFQFAEKDPYIPKAFASQFHQAGSEPKLIKWYTAPHSLDEPARTDRVEWLSEQLGLKDAK